MDIDNRVMPFKDKEKNRLAKVRYREANRERTALASKRWKLNNPDKVRAINRKADLKWKYGISIQEFDQLLESQQYKCAICSISHHDVTYGLYVDHCHKSNEIRGLLCSRCNMGLGLFREQADFLNGAINYLNKYGTK